MFYLIDMCVCLSACVAIEQTRPFSSLLVSMVMFSLSLNSLKLGWRLLKFCLFSVALSYTICHSGPNSDIPDGMDRLVICRLWIWFPVISLTYINTGQVVDTCAAVNKQCNLVLAKGQWWSVAGKVVMGLHVSIILCRIRVTVVLS